jgi:hypothetical protein
MRTPLLGTHLDTKFGRTSGRHSLGDHAWEYPLGSPWENIMEEPHEKPLAETNWGPQCGNWRHSCGKPLGPQGDHQGGDTFGTPLVDPVWETPLVEQSWKFPLEIPIEEHMEINFGDASWLNPIWVNNFLVHTWRPPLRTTSG